ncbi:5'-nucleotidase C-terminal domain-containing protein [Marinilabilia sp.]|uniref:5'-nucleotidase C-terminal domain-containing protein n=1 Tax=Marinilabilia sp. TaxID=2021252 RepID=UPI0025C6003C|nr:5'-nucleotidase [Marinilabilia sp.]
MRQHLFFLILLALASTGCQSHRKPSLTGSRQISIDSTIAPDSTVTAYIAPLRDSVDAIMNEVIGTSPEEMFADKPESPLSSFVADLLREAATKELKELGKEQFPVITVINIRGLRAPLPKGPIKVKHIYALMPFENQMVTLKMSGEDIKKLYQHIGESNGDGLSGGSFSFADQSVKNPKIHNQQVKDEAFYYVVTSDYLATGGDHYTIFAKATEKYESSQKIRDLIIQHIRDIEKQGSLIPVPENKRIEMQ